MTDAAILKGHLRHLPATARISLAVRFGAGGSECGTWQDAGAVAGCSRENARVVTKKALLVLQDKSGLENIEAIIPEMKLSWFVRGR